MCNCASCEHTDSFAGWETDRAKSKGGFKNWPRGNPTGPKRAAAEYAAHVAYSKRGGIERAIPAFKVGGPPVAPHIAGLVMPIQPNALAIRWNSAQAEKARAAEAAPPRPDQPGKAEPHLPAGNRPSEPRAILYVMAKGKSPYMTVPEAARALDCSESRILQWIHEERLPGAIKPARDWLIPSNAKRPAELPRGRPKASASR